MLHQHLGQAGFPSFNEPERPLFTDTRADQASGSIVSMSVSARRRSDRRPALVGTARPRRVCVIIDAGCTGSTLLDCPRIAVLYKEVENLAKNIPSGRYFLET
jgi:hypothetical protein